MSLSVAIEDGLTLHVPQFFCCNCGDAEEIKPITTRVSAARFSMPGNRLTLELALPYCMRCASTSQRKPAGPIKKSLIAGLFALSVGLVALVTPLASTMGSEIFYVTAAAALAAVFGAYSLQKPKGKQTSYYQPVQLTHVKRELSGRVLALTLSFTHVRYAQAFASLNKEALARGALHVLGT